MAESGGSGSFIKEALESAKEEVAKKKAETLAPVETWVAEQIEKTPDELVSNGPYPETTKLPGFKEITLGLAGVYGIKWGMVRVLQDSKEKYFEAHIVDTPMGPHVVRGFSRREWSSIQRRMIEDAKNRLQAHTTEDSDPRWAEADVQMRGEELIVVAGAVMPDYNGETVRSLPTGVVTRLADAVMRASGHEQQSLNPMPLR